MTPIPVCGICRTPLDIPGRVWTRDCGGHCLACMADAGDPECVEAMAPAATANGQMVRLRELSAKADPARVYAAPYIPDRGEETDAHWYIANGFGNLTGAEVERGDAEFFAACWNFVRDLLTVEVAPPGAPE